MAQQRSWAWVVVICLFCGVSLRAQQSGSGSGSSTGAAVDSTPSSGVAATPGAVPRLIKFSGVINPQIADQIAEKTAQMTQNEAPKSTATGAIGVTFSLYALQEGGSPLWSESQQVQLDSQGRYSVLLGATMPEGLPLDLFTSGEALWLGVQAQAPGATEQPRVLLVAVPYALKAADADTLGGTPASAYLSVDNQSPTPQGAGLAAAASAAAGSGSGKGEAEKKQRSTSPSGSGTANYVPLWLDNNGTLGNSVFYQASNGNMGLGTTSPAQVLQVNGSSEILSTGTGAGYKFRMRDGTTDSVWYGMGNVSRFFRTDLGDVISIANNGKGVANVGIGTIAPTQVLQVNGPNEILSTGSGAGFKFQMRDGKTTSVWYGSGNVSRFWRSDYGDVIGITSAGRVGIGTTTPAATLEVYGTGLFDAGIATSSGDVAIKVSPSCTGVGCGNFDLPVTSGPGVGVITMGLGRFIHACCNGNNNTYVGYGSGFVDSTNTGASNTAVGSATLPVNTTGSSNTAIGYQALLATNGGAGGGANNNTAVGNNAGMTNVTGDNDTFLGSGADASGTNGVNLNYATAIGSGAVVAESNALVLGGTGTAGVNVGIGTATPGYTLEVDGVNGVLLNQTSSPPSGSIIVGQGAGTTKFSVDVSGSVLINDTSSTESIITGQAAGTNEFRVDLTGNVYATAYNTGGADFAESVNVLGKRSQYEPGDLLVIDPSGKRRLALSQTAYSTGVAGIYSTKPGVLASPHTMDDPHLKDEVPLAVVGIVPCKVSAANGPIGVGDLLVSSSLPGYAMKGTARSRMLGAVVGKALEPLAKGRGVIQVLVTLQ